MIFIHSIWENTAKNVKNKSANKLTTSKLIAYKGLMATKIYDEIKVTGISICIRICNIDAQIFDWIIDLSIWINWTPQEDGKSNNVAQDGEQQTTTLRWWNQEENHLCKNHLFILK